VGGGRSLAETAGFNPTGDMDVCLLKVLCVVQVEVYVSGRLLVQSPTYNEETLAHQGLSSHEKKIYLYVAVRRTGMRYK